ncbi:MAG: hypothetical protein V3V08_02790 [Nannocystaceae bacterium]
MASSSRNLHPRQGARLVFARFEEDGELGYQVEIFLPGGRCASTSLRWDARGAPLLDPLLVDLQVETAVTKLARVLRREPRARLVRWRKL